MHSNVSPSPKMDSISLNSQRKNISRKPITRLADDESIWNWIFFLSFMRSQRMELFRVFFYISLLHLMISFPLAQLNHFSGHHKERCTRMACRSRPTPSLTDWYMMCIITYFCNYYLQCHRQFGMKMGCKTSGRKWSFFAACLFLPACTLFIAVAARNNCAFHASSFYDSFCSSSACNTDLSILKQL